MRLASYNVENLFLRARALNGKTWEDGKDILKAHADINRILGKDTYTAADKAKIIELLKALGIAKADESKFAMLRQNRGHLVKRPKNKPPEIVANGREDWIGWVELVREEVNEEATRNTARVIGDLQADVLGVVEAESRPALVRFSKNVLPAVSADPYEHIMLIDGNDERGIDVGIMTRQGYEIVSICSHVDDRDAGGFVFSRDCAHYEIRTPKDNTLIVLVNHFKSKGFGAQSDSNAKRKRQAERVKDIYNHLRQKHPHIAVIGDLNDTPASDPLSPLVTQTDLKEIASLQGFDDQGRPGTYKNGTASNKIDYLLLSPALLAKTSAGGINRLGVWGGTNGTLFPHFPEITREVEAASDHAAIWADIDI
jgi:endonuclease/exonuclease/phosphatase family metal-dependent hydrolase